MKCQVLRRYVPFASLLVVSILMVLVSVVPTAHAAVGPQTLYVSVVGSDTAGDGSAGSPYRTITRGLTAAIADDTVQVAAGLYTDDETFPIGLKSGVVLQGDGAGSTTIQGDGTSSVIVADGVDAATKIDGFLITGGIGYLYGDAQRYGGGIFCDNGAAPTISNNAVSGNGNPIYGGGVAIRGGSSPTVSDNAIESNSAGRGGGIYILSSTPAIRDNDIEANSVAAYGGGIYCQASSPAISGNTISGNTSSVSGGGLYLTSASPSMTNNVIAGNIATDGIGGIVIANSSNPVIANCTIQGNSSPGIQKGGSSNPTIFNNIVWENGDDLSGCTATYSDIEDVEPGVGNISADPLFVNKAGGDYHLQATSPAIDAGTNTGAPTRDFENDIRPQDGDLDGGYETDMGADEARGGYVWRVDDSNTSGIEDGTEAYPFNTTGEGIAAASAGHEVRVAAGTYSERVTLKSGVVLQGAGAGTTTIDGGGGGSAVTASDCDAETKIDGFTITGGDATNGGGIYCSGGAGPTISNNLVTGNHSGDQGGGIWVTGSSPLITGNTVTTNTAAMHGAGASFSTDSGATFSGNTVYGNDAVHSGGGVFSYSTEMTISGNTITANHAGDWGGGIFSGYVQTTAISDNVVSGNTATNGGGIAVERGAPVIDGNEIEDNTATAGGGGVFVWYGGDPSTPSLSNDVISGNDAADGGGILIGSGAEPTIRSATITGNSTADGIGGGIQRDGGGSYSIVGSIIWDNGDDLDGCSATYSDISSQDDTPGAGNISADPEFVDLAGCDYHVKGTSPVIDAGTNTGAPPTDKDEVPRPLDGDGDGSTVCDIGAYERPCMLINNGTKYTQDLTSTIQSFFDVCIDMRWKNEDGAWADWAAYSASTDVTLSASDGTRTIDAEYRHGAGRTVVVSDDIVLDRTAPSGEITVNGGDSWVNTTTVTLDLSATDGLAGVEKMRISNDGVFDDEPWEDSAATKSWVLGSGDAIKTVYVQFKDAAGNESSVATDEILLDTTGPSGSVAINGGDEFTNNPPVSLDLSADDGTGSGFEKMRISGDGAFDDEPWEDFAPSWPWVITGGDGIRGVWVQFKDKAGNVSAPAQDSIWLDRQGPTGSVTIDDGNAYATNRAVYLDTDATDVGGTGVRWSRVSDDGAWDTEIWDYHTPGMSWTLPSGDGTKTVYVQYRDRAMNVSGTYQDDIVLDTLAPSGTFAINESEAHTATTTASLDCTITGAEKMRYRDKDGVWTGWEDYGSGKAWTLPTGDGTKTVEAEYKDAAGNVTSRTDDILLDTTAPTGTISIDDGAAWTTQLPVTVTASFVDPGSGTGLDEMRLSDDGVSWTGWGDFAGSKAWTLPSGDGNKTVYVQVRDLAGNVSDTTSDGIGLDTAAPTGTVTIDGDAAVTSSTAVGLALDATDAAGSGVASMTISNDGVFDTEPWVAYASTKDWTLEGDDGTKTVYVAIRDEAGNVSSPVLSDAILYDKTAPSGTFAIDNDVTYSATVTASLDCTITGAEKMRYRDKDGVWTGWEDYGSGKAWTLPTGDGTKTVEAEYKDAAGNVTSRTDDILLDTTAPNPATALVATGGDELVDLSWSNPTTDFAAARVLRSEVDYASSPEPGTDQTLVLEGTETTTTDNGLTNGTRYFYTVYVRDSAANYSLPVTATAVPAVATRMTCIGNNVNWSYGARVAIKGQLRTDPARSRTGRARDARSVEETLEARTNVTVWRSGNGTTWSRDGSADWNASSGYYETTRTITAKTYFRMQFDGQPAELPCVSNSIVLSCYAYLGRPWLVPTSPVRRRGLTVYGYLKPRHAGKTRLDFYRYSRGKYRFYSTRYATNRNYSTHTRYQLGTSLYYPGAYYVKAVHADSNHMTTVGPARYFTVR